MKKRIEFEMNIPTEKVQKAWENVHAPSSDAQQCDDWIDEEQARFSEVHRNFPGKRVKITIELVPKYSTGANTNCY